jgi:tryptophan-rich sensory protein
MGARSSATSTGLRLLLFPAPYLAWSLFATALTAVVAPDSVTPDRPLLT